MDELEGQVTINGEDIWTEYGAFLAEEKRGGRDNLKAIMAPSAGKSHVGVDIRERDGVKYSAKLDTRNKERDVTLHFAITADNAKAWMARYRAFLELLKKGEDGWLDITFESIGVTLRVFYVNSTEFTPLANLWYNGMKQASRFKVTFREPEPVF